MHAGSASFIYTLGPIGNRLLGDRRRVHEPSLAFLDHAEAEYKHLRDTAQERKAQITAKIEALKA